ncbi:hypothetical protein QBC38DRAFT_54273 [Podospora fimiseda]|uniref:C2H2 type master regulator of conidiophore development brlA n=1 Tax=Podospora fimiseda TaxID=252190 RepID=A0AAN7GNL4_9PEZI|nr:hypothetical protein QBC38DRAFT_54273 [Podospora fimiseda]
MSELLATPAQGVLPTEPQYFPDFGCTSIDLGLDFSWLALEAPSTTYAPPPALTEGSDIGFHTGEQPTSTNSEHSNSVTETSQSGSPRAPSSSPHSSSGTTSSSRGFPTACPYTCSTCLRQYDTPKKLKQHAHKYHKMEHPCPHDNCDRAFDLVADLKRHLDTIKHGGKRQFGCPRPGCQKMFTRRDNMRRHVNEDHDQITTRRKAVKQKKRKISVTLQRNDME